MVVPYVPRVENPIETQISTIDQEMESILQDKNKSVDEKVKLYNSVLLKYVSTVDRFNLSKAIQNEDYADSFSTQIAEKMYNKIKPEIDSLKTQRKTHMQPKKLTFEDQIMTPQQQPESSKLTLNDTTLNVTNNDENLLENKFENTLYRSALEENFQDSPEQQQPTSNTQKNETKEETNEDDEKELIKKAKTIQYSIDDSKPEKIGEWNFNVISVNNKPFLVPDCFTDAAYRIMLTKNPMGVNVPKMIKFMQDKGVNQLDAILDKYGDDKSNRNWKTREINNFFKKCYENFRLDKQPQNGNALFEKQFEEKTLLKNWIFNKYF